MYKFKVKIYKCRWEFKQIEQIDIKFKEQIKLINRVKNKD